MAITVTSHEAAQTRLEVPHKGLIYGSLFSFL